VTLWRALFSGGGEAADSEARPAAQQPPADGCGSPPTVLCGHSMGGAVAVHAAATGGTPPLPPPPCMFAARSRFPSVHGWYCKPACARDASPLRPTLPLASPPLPRLAMPPHPSHVRQRLRLLRRLPRPAGIPSLAGVVVIDVVEGTALASLPYMAGVLAKRPRRFNSLQQAVGWALDSGGRRRCGEAAAHACITVKAPPAAAWPVAQRCLPERTVWSRSDRTEARSSPFLAGSAPAGMCKRQEAAHVSLPAMLRPEGAGEGGCGVDGQPAEQPLAATGLAPLPEEEGGEEAAEGTANEGRQGQATPPEQQQEGQQQQQQQQRGGALQPAGGSSGGGGWVWRTQLERSAPFWEGWYLGLSDAFLRLAVPKVRPGPGCGCGRRSLLVSAASRAPLAPISPRQLTPLTLPPHLPHRALNPPPPPPWSRSLCWWAPTGWTAPSPSARCRASSSPCCCRRCAAPPPPPRRRLAPGTAAARGCCHGGPLRVRLVLAARALVARSAACLPRVSCQCGSRCQLARVSWPC
jgi:pimeloyl-ACP methyl ester carboxylesterase